MKVDDTEEYLLNVGSIIDTIFAGMGQRLTAALGGEIVEFFSASLSLL